MLGILEAIWRSCQWRATALTASSTWREFELFCLSLSFGFA
jgi:hypothetical protein